MHKELRPLYSCRTTCFKPLASWFSQLLRFPRTLHRSLLRKFQAMTIHIHREPSPPVLVCRYLHTRFINCHGNLLLQMSKTKATNFLRLIAFGLIIYVSYFSCRLLNGFPSFNFQTLIPLDMLPVTNDAAVEALLNVTSLCKTKP